jgi:hypothetical protein
LFKFYSILSLLLSTEQKVVLALSVFLVLPLSCFALALVETFGAYPALAISKHISFAFETI